MEPLKIANLVLKFVLELVAFAAFAIWGATVSVVVAIAAPAAAIALWAIFAAPRSARRLPTRARVPFELGVFALAAVALAAADHVTAAVAFAVIAAANAAFLAAFGDDGLDV